MKKYGMLVDVYYCTGCHSCEVACEQENGLGVGQFGIKVTEQILDEYSHRMLEYVRYVTALCNGCMSRVLDGRRPSCCKHCLAQCLSFGPIDEIVEEAKKAKKPIVYLR
ncbi:MAG: oxidoreductase [Oscillospiraceae bacterium]|nr:oxidoreductase [Oscillospiraceae bacterium]